MRSNDPDLLSLFFADIARIPILGGMEQILPLTRRVMRGQMLRGLSKQPTPSELRNLLIKRDQLQAEFVTLCNHHCVSPLDVTEIAAQAEAFLDDPRQDTPPALSLCFASAGKLAKAQNEALLEVGWMTFYSLAALPPAIRLLPVTAAIPEGSEQDLRRVRREGRTAKRQLVNGTLRYPIGIARYYLGQGLDYLELVNEGMFGLMKAAERYREWRGVHFQQYASNWIQQRIRRAIADHGRMVRVPVHAHDEYQSRLTPLIEEYLSHGMLDHENLVAARMGWAKDETRKKMRHYRTGLPPASLDRVYKYKGQLVRFEQIADDSNPPEASLNVHWASDGITEALRIFDERTRNIMTLRYGLGTGKAQSLEQVGQTIGVTRERIRQIEAKVFRKLQHPTRSRRLADFFDLMNEPLHGAPRSDEALNALSHAVHESDIYGDTTLDEIATARERQHIDAMFKQSIPHGTKGYNTGSKKTSLLFVMRAALEQLGKPTHYQEVLTTAQQIAPNHPSLTPERVYASLFYGSKYFLRHGNGVFGLVEWGALTHAAEDGRLTSCPAPLLPPDADPSAFFESVVEGQYMLQQHPLSARQFWAKMASWARLGTLDDMQAQTAFDAWYAAGLIDRVHFSENGTGPLVLQMSEEMSLSAMRRWCVDSLCKRVDKMPELMASLGRSIRASTSELQRALFGDAHAGHDVPNRLLLLAAFGAVQSEGSLWRLTDLGRAALEANPPDELPDEDAAERETPSDDETAVIDDLDLLLLF